MGITEDGIAGEQMAFKYLRAKGYKFFQPDAISKKNGEWYLWECKYQEMFESPPFDGHGLGKWQVEARLKFQKEVGVIAMFIVFEKGKNDIYIQRFDVLEEGEYLDTKGVKPRRIYPLTSFDHHVI